MGRQFFRDGITADKQQVPENQMPITQAPEDWKNSGNSRAKSVLEQSTGPKTGDKFLPDFNLDDGRKSDGKAPDATSRWENLKIDQSPVKQHSFGQATMSIARPIASGAWNEITEHYGRVALSGAVGFGVGYGLTFLSPTVTKYLAVGGLLLTGYQLVKNVPTWYESGKVLANPNSSYFRRLEAELVMKGIGAGSVDLTAGIIGGAIGSRVGWNYQMELQKPVRFDSAGRPIKMPLPNDKGFAHVKYDKSGRVTELVEQYNDFTTPKGNVQEGWRNIIRTYKSPGPGREYYTYGHDGFLESEKVKWLGKFSYDKSGLTMVDETGITQLRTNGASAIVRTADQAAKMQAAKAAFAQEYKTAAEAVRRLTEQGALGAGAAGMAGIARIIR